MSSANVASSAPTIVLRRPCSASTGVRASGASTKRTSAFASASRILVVVAGSLVDVSTTIIPGRAAPATPSGPKTTSSTCGAPVTHRITMSDARARSAFVFTSVAPRFTRSSTGARLRWPRTASGKPFSTRFFAMPWPISPTPTMPMRCFAIMGRSVDGGGRQHGPRERGADRRTILRQSPASGSVGTAADCARRRSCSVIVRPLPAMIAMPASA